MASINKSIIINPRNQNQRKFIEAVENNTIVFAIGVAGTGKTHISVSCAIKALKEKKTKRIIITRPAVESGEHLGFLPGSLQEKLDPFLRPLFDVFRTHIPPEELMNLIENGTIEIAPLAFIRGRTFSDCFVILDESQNTTQLQMKMFLTRLGSNSKMIINGDITQIDLPGGAYRSGLVEIDNILYEDIPGIAWVEFDRGDIVRHPVVKAVVFAYERYEQKREQLVLEPVSLNGDGS